MKVTMACSEDFTFMSANHQGCIGYFWDARQCECPCHATNSRYISLWTRLMNRCGVHPADQAAMLDRARTAARNAWKDGTHDQEIT